MSLHHFVIAKHMPKYPIETLIFAAFNTHSGNTWEQLRDSFPEIYAEWIVRNRSQGGIIEGDAAF